MSEDDRGAIRVQSRIAGPPKTTSAFQLERSHTSVPSPQKATPRQCNGAFSKTKKNQYAVAKKDPDVAVEGRSVHFNDNGPRQPLVAVLRSKLWPHVKPTVGSWATPVGTTLCRATLRDGQTLTIRLITNKTLNSVSPTRTDRKLGRQSLRCFSYVEPLTRRPRSVAAPKWPQHAQSTCRE